VRISLALICALALLASQYFFVYLEAAQLMGWPDAVYRWLDPWLPVVIAIVSSIIMVVVLKIIEAICETDRCSTSKS